MQSMFWTKWANLAEELRIELLEFVVNALCHLAIKNRIFAHPIFLDKVG